MSGHAGGGCETRRRARAREWLNFLVTKFHKQLLWPLKAGPEETLSAQRETVRKVLVQLEKHLAACSHLLGDRFAADAYAFTVANWCNYVKIDLAPYPNVRAFHAHVGERSSVRAALQAEGLA